MGMIRYSSVWVFESPDGAISKEKVDNYVLMNLEEKGGEADDRNPFDSCVLGG